MITKLTINNQDFLPFLAEDGISYSMENRNERSVVTLGGTLYQIGAPVYPMNVTCVAVNDEALQMILGALSTSPASVTYSNRFTKTESTALFYVSGISFTENSIAGTSTTITGISFDLIPREG